MNDLLQYLLLALLGLVWIYTAARLISKAVVRSLHEEQTSNRKDEVNDEQE